MRQIIIKAFLAFLLSTCLPAAIYAQTKPIQDIDDDSQKLISAVRKIIPKASLVIGSEVDKTACGNIRNPPGYVRGDFNGDGKEVFAVLVKTKIGVGTQVWGTKKLREAKFALVLLAGSEAGEFKSKIIHRFEDFIPTVGTISIQGRGVIRDRETGKAIRLQHEAILFTLCEKSATVFYVTNRKVHAVSIAD